MIFYVVANNEIRVIEESSAGAINPTATVVKIADTTIICAIHTVLSDPNTLKSFPILTTSAVTDASGMTTFKIKNSEFFKIDDGSKMQHTYETNYELDHNFESQPIILSSIDYTSISVKKIIHCSHVSNPTEVYLDHIQFRETDTLYTQNSFKISGRTGSNTLKCLGA